MNKYLFSALAITVAVLTVPLGVIAGEVISAIVTVPPQEYLVSSIGGEKVEVTTMVPEDGSPHSSSLTPGEMMKVRESQVYFKVGTPLSFELNNASVFKKENPNMKVVNTSEGIDLKTLSEHYGHEHSGRAESSGEKSVDPHVWLSPDNLEIMAENIYSALACMDPGAGGYFEDNLNDLKEKINQVEGEIEGLIGDHEGEHFIVYHPAWGYFGDGFNLIQVAVEEGGKEPGPGKIRDIANFAQNHGIKILIASSQFDPSMARMVAKTFRGEVAVVNPLSRDILSELVVLAEKIVSGYPEP
ncbi:zinc ABC transporter substrate-binding protein [Candidatus Bipolaricaulota bacterium]|nr:zinc ABC transporter substrate-binding protein [Candidatus Bipolaricaulota bacterium]